MSCECISDSSECRECYNKSPIESTGDPDACPACHKTPTKPRQLPCEHVLCFECVKEIVSKAERRNNLVCPKCKEAFAIPRVPAGSSAQPKYVKENYKASIDKLPRNNTLHHDGKIMGMAILDEKLFVICKSPPDVIFKHDIGSERGSEREPAKLKIPGMIWPRGMAANERLGCLYISDWNGMLAGRLWRYKYQREQDNFGACIVATLDVQPFGVSVSPKNDMILVTCATPANIFVKRGWIYVFHDTGNDVQKVKTVLLENLEIPRHAVLTAASNYLVCHGWTKMSHGVSSLQQDETGRIVKATFYGSDAGGKNGQMEMNQPLSMALDEDGLVLVVDYSNHRIQLLTEDLHLVRHLITKEHHGIEYPRHVCLCPKTGRLYVSQEDGNVYIFQVLIG